MPIKGFKWVWVAAAAAATLAVLSLSYSSYENLGVRKPLMNALLADSDVAAAAARREGPITVVEVTLKKVPDLAVSYVALEKTVKRHMGSSPFRIELKDSRTPELEHAYHSVHFYVEEASARGTFGAMMEKSAKSLEEAGFHEYKFSVDNERIYVQISNPGGHFYKVVARLTRTEGGGA